MTKNLVCSDCNVMMTAGFIPDFSFGEVFQLLWAEGKPKAGFISSIKNDIRKRKRYYISAYRCEQCGALKLFADANMPAY